MLFYGLFVLINLIFILPILAMEDATNIADAAYYRIVPSCTTTQPIILYYTALFYNQNDQIVKEQDITESYKQNTTQRSNTIQELNNLLDSSKKPKPSKIIFENDTIEFLNRRDERIKCFTSSEITPKTIYNSSFAQTFDLSAAQIEIADQSTIKKILNFIICR